MIDDLVKRRVIEPSTEHQGKIGKNGLKKTTVAETVIVTEIALATLISVEVKANA